jgi:hypothetical protein
MHSVSLFGLSIIGTLVYAIQATVTYGSLYDAYGKTDENLFHAWQFCISKPTVTISKTVVAPFSLNGG